MHYFITGTAGFIGFHLARRLLQDGHQVTGFDGLTPYYNVKLKHMRHAALAQFPSPAIAYAGRSGKLQPLLASKE